MFENTSPGVRHDPVLAQGDRHSGRPQPIGTARKGTLADTDVTALAGTVLSAVVERSGREPDDIDDLVLAESYQGGGDLARYVAVQEGLTKVPGIAVNRQCASSLSAVAIGSAQIASDMAATVLAGGAESLSTSPMLRKRKPFTLGKAAEDYIDPWMALSHPPTPDAPATDISITVGWNVAQQYGISREDQDQWSLRSHHRAIKAIDSGSFVDEIVPIEVKQADGSTLVFDTDEHPRRNSRCRTWPASRFYTRRSRDFR